MPAKQVRPSRMSRSISACAADPSCRSSAAHIRSHQVPWSALRAAHSPDTSGEVRAGSQPQAFDDLNEMEHAIEADGAGKSAD